MGAQTFCQVASGKTAQEAFRSAVDSAEYAYGHAGYTGTIAEKDDFITLPVSPERLAEIKADWRLEYSDEDPLWQKVNEKWGPAGCVQLDKDLFLFFGWASS